MSTLHCLLSLARPGKAFRGWNHPHCCISWTGWKYIHSEFHKVERVPKRVSSSGSIQRFMHFFGGWQMQHPVCQTPTMPRLSQFVEFPGIRENMQSNSQRLEPRSIQRKHSPGNGTRYSNTWLTGSGLRTFYRADIGTFWCASIDLARAMNFLMKMICHTCHRMWSIHCQHASFAHQWRAHLQIQASLGIRNSDLQCEWSLCIPWYSRAMGFIESL